MSPSSLMARVKSAQQHQQQAAVAHPPPPLGAASVATTTLAAAAAGGGRPPSATPAHAAAPCRYYREGTCRFGDGCRFYHGDPPPGSSSTSTTPAVGGARRKRWGDPSGWGDESSDSSSSKGVSEVSLVHREVALPAATAPASVSAEDKAPPSSRRPDESLGEQSHASYAAVVVSSPVNSTAVPAEPSIAEGQVATTQQTIILSLEQRAQAATAPVVNSPEEEAPTHDDDAPEQIRNLHTARSNLDEALRSHHAEYQTYVDRIDAAESAIVERYGSLRRRKDAVAAAHGNPIASGTDLMEINAGGRIVLARRGTLCQFEGTRMGALFGGTREGSLRRDGEGRIFLDVGADAFRAIADYLSDLGGRSEAGDAPPDPPDGNDEYDRLVLIELLEVLGVHDRIMPSEGDKREEDARADANNATTNDLEAAAAFAPAVNDALNARLDAIKDAESELLLLENNFVDHEEFITKFACGDGAGDDLVSLNVSGTIMTTTRSTLRMAEDSILSRIGQASATRFADGWSPDDVGDWIDAMDNGVPDGTGDVFRDEYITGRELLVLNLEAIRALGIRIGAASLLLDEIRKLRGRSNGEPPFLEHSPRCVGKILNYLRLGRLRSAGLAQGAPPRPVVRASERRRFERTVRCLFPGAGAESILGGGPLPRAGDVSEQRG